MHVFKHPKFYEEYRKRAKEVQREAKLQAASIKPQATQTLKETDCSSDKNQEQQASSHKHQAPSNKR